MEPNFTKIDQLVILTLIHPVSTHLSDRRYAPRT
jgi:hypothetical protein